MPQALGGKEESTNSVLDVDLIGSLREPTANMAVQFKYEND
jgi:hypothetical protein